MHGRELCYVYISYLFYRYLYKTKPEKRRKNQNGTENERAGLDECDTKAPLNQVFNQGNNTLLYFCLCQSVCLFFYYFHSCCYPKQQLETNEDESPGEEKQNLDVDHTEISKRGSTICTYKTNQNKIRQRRRRKL